MTKSPNPAPPTYVDIYIYIPAVILHLPLPLLYRILLLLRPLPQADEHANKKNEDSKKRTLGLGRWDARGANIRQAPRA